MDQKSKNIARKPKAYAKIFAFVSVHNSQALILRRGPTTNVGVYSWDTTNDQIIARQWLKGRIYEYRSDLSPDGKYFIYSVNKRGWGYTVISQAPWIKAISLWKSIGGWGGGIFSSKTKYILKDDLYTKEFISTKLVEDNANSHLLEHGAYHARLLKTGWFLKSHDKKSRIYVKQLSDGYSLEKIVICSYNNPTGEKHRLISGEVILNRDSWEWCEWKDGWLVWAESGCLYRSQLPEDIFTITGKLIYDFNVDKFREKAAPY